MTVGRLGNGVAVPGQAGKESPPISPSPLRGNKCETWQRDYSQTNDDRSYEYRNPAEVALRALIMTATSSIFISQQDLLSCQPRPAIATEALFDERVFAALAVKVIQKVPIKIILSNAGNGGYGNGYTPKDVAQTLTRMVAARQHIDATQARNLVCGDVSLGGIHNAVAGTWPSGQNFSNHAKLVAVDNRAFYIGSQNLYPARLQELGLIVESAQAAATLKSAYLDPLWSNSRFFALIDPAGRWCGEF